MNITELYNKRASAWEEAKNFLDTHTQENGTMTAEDAATYEKMEADISNLSKQIDRQQRLDEMENAMRQPASTPITNKPAGQQTMNAKEGRASDEYKNAFWSMIRNKTLYPDLRNALQIGTDSEGGFLVPDEYERTLIQALEEENVMRSLCTVIQTSSGDRKIPVVAAHGTASWVDEEGQIPESDDAFGQISIGAHKLATMIRVSNELLQDSVFNIDSYIATEFARRIGSKEEEGFIVGDGSGKPYGILNDTNGAVTGVTTASATAIVADEIIDLVHSLKSVYRKKAQFMMNDTTIKAIRKLKDGNGNYLWQPGLKEGQPDMLLNFRIATSSYMPEIATGNKVILFGDFKYYWIADRQGRTFQRLNELYAVTDQVGFKATQRVDGRLVLAEAMKCLAMK